MCFFLFENVAGISLLLTRVYPSLSCRGGPELFSTLNVQAMGGGGACRRSGWRSRGDGSGVAQDVPDRRG
jgi:hypothetical protein